MAYSDFSLRDLTRRLDLAVETSPDLFGTAPDLPESPLLQELLTTYLPLAKAINTEKAGSESLIAPILVELLQRFHGKASPFSGTEFPAAPEQGLTGSCDFILTRSPQQLFLTAPLVIVVEAKDLDLKAGLGQCGAAMVGARLFNDRDGTPSATIYGVVTTGTLWQFLRLDGQRPCIEDREYALRELPRILGILEWMLDQGGEATRRVA